MLLYGAEVRRTERAKADLIEAVAIGYAGCRSEEGNQAMDRMLHALRKR